MTRVVVVGAGNAALCAALAAREAGADVEVLERAPRAESGGNSAYTAGAMRVAYTCDDDLRAVLRDSSGAELARCDFGAYPAEAFVEDLARLSDGRADVTLTRSLASGSLPTLEWMARHGVVFEPSYGQQAFEQDGRWRFWGGLAVRVRGEGKGLVGALGARCAALGVRVRHTTRAVRLVRSGDRIAGVVVESGEDVPADGVVLASGGFEANARWRAEHLGAAWEHAKVRGTAHNTGDGIAMALDAGAATAGDWSGCHAVAWDAGAPDHGDLDVAHEYTRNSYQFGICVNVHGERFVDEGEDFRNYTYAKYGRRILEQPGGVAWQVFDAKATRLLRREYFRDDASVVEAGTLEQLAQRMDGIDASRFVDTLRAFNERVRSDVVFDPAVKDGRGTVGLSVPKSNWATAIDAPPFRAWRVACGITFTFGGLAIDASARVLDSRGHPVAGLYAAGELAGGLWYGNYPGGAGLTAGAHFGRLAGAAAAASQTR